MLSSATAEVSFDGFGLRHGKPARVALRARPGPSVFIVGSVVTPISSARVVGTDRSTTVLAGSTKIALVEHVLAACAAFGLHSGLAIEVEGGEVPLLDGAAGQFSRGLEALALPRSRPPLRVVKDGVVRHGASHYTFERARGASPAVHVHVALELDDPRLVPRASWDGTTGDFAPRIAAARTFVLAEELPSLAQMGHASRADAESVVVITPEAILSAGAPFEADEPARHKLLDLLGDLFLYGGPPRGSVRAFRPGHGATHAILREALATGVVA